MINLSIWFHGIEDRNEYANH